jgi:hypothetical protein
MQESWMERFFPVLGIEPRASHVLSKLSATDRNSQPSEGDFHEQRKGAIGERRSRAESTE